jgi:hypothetical protein
MFSFVFNKKIDLLFSAIIPMSEYSTMEHVLQIHDNHSEQFSINSDDGNDMPTYRHVEHIKTSASMIPFSLMNATDVSCSPKFSLRKLNISRITREIYYFLLSYFFLYFFFKTFNYQNFLMLIERFIVHYLLYVY